MPLCPVPLCPVALCPVSLCRSVHCPVPCVLFCLLPHTHSPACPPRFLFSFQVMNTAPVLNGGTAFTSVMSPATGFYNTTVRRGSAPNEAPESDLVQKGSDLLAALLDWGNTL